MKKKIFKMKEEHFILLENTCIGWDDAEFGAPCIDPKRPYGNSSVLSDMREILKDEGNKCPHCEETLPGDTKYTNAQLNKLHTELEIALQIILKTQTFATGTYEKEEFGREWSYVKGT